jgi:Leucine-rich repeat (LRR) protein
MVDVFRNKLLDLLNSAKNESSVALAETKRLINVFFHTLGTSGGVPEAVGPANISADLRQQVEVFLNYLKSIEDEMLENQEDYTAVVINVYPMVAGRRRKSKTRKHIKRRKHTRKNIRKRKV